MSEIKVEQFPVKLETEKHLKYLKELNNHQDELEYWLTEALRLNGIYWGVTAACILKHPEIYDFKEMTKFILSCQNEDGGFGGCTDHDSHLLYTLSAIQVLVICDTLSEVDKDKVVEYVSKLQNPDGSFSGDEWGEVDTRFSYCALSCLKMLHRLDAVDVPKAVEYIKKCMNFDGGFGSIESAESHSGQIFCCVGALAIVDRLDVVDADKLGWWLAERQLPNGGLNGRPEKLEDVCYSWWVLSSLSIIDRIHWINKEKLINFILSCQDADTGGFSDRPGDMVDVFHTLFGVTGLSLLGYPNLDKIDPVYCMPVSAIERLNIKTRTYNQI
ncbi:terpenoid cyclases/Protein prenyltransferase [Piromyces finnis]|uniref:Geranylgeranyl transferase type-2 subunit beta n=1 Tax=Piromyces finnis TaxID=1754191 RepID=A0A1Y1VDB4_9FUNG|nr:terpenoid cyclases/Protein prenyltransferase [Piromyces finnis]|eukprot:ORX53400.1 terpenoid cyclases/Protein prenyltransferase [Piromyces finnis]